MDGKRCLVFQKVAELLSDYSNLIQTWVFRSGLLLLCRKLGAMRNTLVTDERAFR